MMLALGQVYGDMCDLIPLYMDVYHTYGIIDNAQMPDNTALSFERLGKTHNCNTSCITQALENPSTQNDLAKEELVKLRDRIAHDLINMDAYMTRKDPNYKGIEPLFPKPLSPIGRELADLIARKRAKF